MPAVIPTTGTPQVSASRTAGRLAGRGLHLITSVPAPAAVPAQRGASRVDVLNLLGAGIPLTLLLDLAHPAGPDSLAILEDERAARAQSAAV